MRKIPKIVHYCWFGNGEKPDNIKAYIETWKAKMPEYTFMEWNEQNFDVENSIPYVRQAYEAKKYAFVSDYARMNTVAMYAPSKTFNLAGLVGSYSIIYNKWLRERVEKEASLCHYNSMNLLSMYALIGAYKDEGHEWTDELCQVIAGNVD